MSEDEAFRILAPRTVNSSHPGGVPGNRQGAVDLSYSPIDNPAIKRILLIMTNTASQEPATTTLTDRLTVEAGCSSPTTTGVDGALDVNFTLYLQTEEMAARGCHQVEIEGEVTLVPREDGRPGYAAWGSRDHWLDGRTCRAIRELNLDDTDERRVLDEIEAACAAVCS